MAEAKRQRDVTDVYMERNISKSSLNCSGMTDYKFSIPEDSLYTIP